jgi:hypothetical protein
VFIEPAGEFAGVALAAVEPQGKGAQSAQRQECLEGSGSTTEVTKTRAM